MTYAIRVTEYGFGPSRPDRLNEVRQNENKTMEIGLQVLQVSQTVSSVSNRLTTASSAVHASPKQLQTPALTGETE